VEISFAVWNVEKFKYLPQRVRAVSALIQNHSPDVFALLEFLEKKAARKLIRTDYFREYDFGVTDSVRGMEILVGWKRRKFSQVLYTQRRDFQASNLDLRPGGLLSVFPVSNEEVCTNFLFLHTDSGTDAAAFENRSIMFRKIWSLQQALAQIPEQNGSARLIAMGDLNTMGRRGGPNAKAEIAGLSADAEQKGMRLLSKSHDTTWSSDGARTSNLDHVLASSELTFVRQQPSDAEITLDGWISRYGDERVNFAKNISDHCLLFGRLRN